MLLFPALCVSLTVPTPRAVGRVSSVTMREQVQAEPLSVENLEKSFTVASADVKPTDLFEARIDLQLAQAELIGQRTQMRELNARLAAKLEELDAQTAAEAAARKRASRIVLTQSDLKAPAQLVKSLFACTVRAIGVTVNGGIVTARVPAAAWRTLARTLARDRAESRVRAAVERREDGLIVVDHEDRLHLAKGFIVPSGVRASEFQVPLGNCAAAELVGEEVGEQQDAEIVGEEISVQQDAETVGEEISEQQDAEPIGEEISVLLMPGDTRAAFSRKYLVQR